MQNRNAVHTSTHNAGVLCTPTFSDSSHKQKLCCTQHLGTPSLPARLKRCDFQYEGVTFQTFFYGTHTCAGQCMRCGAPRIADKRQAHGLDTRQQRGSKCGRGRLSSCGHLGFSPDLELGRALIIVAIGRRRGQNAQGFDRFECTARLYCYGAHAKDRGWRCW